MDDVSISNHTIPKPPITKAKGVIQSEKFRSHTAKLHITDSSDNTIPENTPTISGPQTQAKYLPDDFSSLSIISQRIPQNLSPRHTPCPTKRFLPHPRRPSPLHTHAPIPTICATVACASLRAHRTRPPPSHKSLQFSDPPPQPLILTLRFFHLLPMQSHVFVSRG